MNGDYPRSKGVHDRYVTQFSSFLLGRSLVDRVKHSVDKCKMLCHITFFRALNYILSFVVKDPLAKSSLYSPLKNTV